MRANLILLILISILWSLNLYAHGEGQLGPHQGIIRMPGPFHVEVVSGGSNEFKVYLIDLEFKNPTIEDSTVNAYWYRGKKFKQLICKTETDHFTCVSKISFQKKDKIEIRSKRKGISGNFADYEYPFKVKR